MAMDVLSLSRLGEGSFGLVYEGKMKTRTGIQNVVLKRAKSTVQDSEELQDLERILNERVRKDAKGSCADYIGHCRFRAGSASLPALITPRVLEQQGDTSSLRPAPGTRGARRQPPAEVGPPQILRVGVSE
ncbi:hypothetical protein CYMTET_11121 [Cymbomonas tetramitiformis]|uniref:Protein kinase domain-containing protein n=1 Tax=Cymbomonas tetramitiformis TaxID=36881 RepID=A0AAE0LD51_9CHLO|nr:hypothetical protein CYMTET_11121 [Cymbomonas tetramitiformis]